MKHLLLAALAATAFAAPAKALTTETRTMRFEDCLDAIWQVARDLDAAPTTVVQTQDIRIVRFSTTDGSVLVTCSRPDGKMGITR